MHPSVYENFESYCQSVPLSVLENVSKLYGLELCDFIDDTKSINDSPIVLSYSEGLLSDDMKLLANFNHVVPYYIKLGASDIRMTSGAFFFNY